MMERGNGWYFKNYWLGRIYARKVHHRFWLASYERLNIWNKYKHKYSHDLDCFETKCNVDDIHVDVYLINIQYNIINIDCRKG